ncbi:hypothetical protein [Streptantibioticus ferralitis]|uniref:Uncharacterized protein n=2 Tax=Streptantibioticus ferralitis TaxID=236510 RepID=A0ABT5YZT0_9ACTN|nr:hypothetical protein [Streptantibioticus ferralitis]MDF2256290.1 hypothetical protein [Streptantibioticus ferralitis]
MSVRSKRPPIPMEARTTDGPFGPVHIRHDPWPAIVVQVQGAGMPTVRVAVPDREHAAMTVNGQRAPLSSPGRWRLRRKSRTRHATVGNRGYALTPTGLRTSLLLRDGVPIADVLGTLAAYSPLRDLPGNDARLVWHGGIDPTDVAVGQAMVIGFGAGAPGALLGTIHALLDMCFTSVR